MAADDLLIRARLVGGTETKRGLDEIRSSATGTARDIDRAASQSSSALDRAASRLGGLGKMLQPLGSINPVLGQVTGGVDTLSSRLGDMSTNAAAAGGGLASGVAAGANVATAALVGLTAIGEQSFLSVANGVKDFQNVTGLAAEDASKLVAIMRAVGVPTEAAAQAFFRFGKNIETNAATLERYGVQIARNRDGSVNVLNTLYALSDAYRANADQTQRNALVQAAFGRGGAAVIEVLQRTRGELKGLADQAAASGLVFDQDQVEQVEQFGIAMQQLMMAGEGLTISLAQGVTPALTDVAHAIAPVLQLLTRTGVLSGALEGLLAGKLAAALVTQVASMAAWAASLGNVNVEARLAAVGLGELATAEGAAAVAGAGASAQTASFSATVGAAAGPVGLVVGLLVGGVPILEQWSKSVRNLDGHIRRMADESGRQLLSTFDDLTKKTNQGGNIFGRAARALFGAEDYDKKSVAAFRDVAEQNLAVSQRIIDTRKASGLSTAAFERIQREEIATQRALNEAAAQNADILGDVSTAAADVGQAYSAASDGVKRFNDDIGSTVGMLLDNAAASRSYRAEVDKLGTILRSTSDAQAEAAKSARAVEAAQDRVADARERLAEATKGVSEEERRSLALAVRRDEFSARSAERDLAKQQDRLQQMIEAGRSRQEIDTQRAAVEDADIRVGETRGAVAKSREALAAAQPGSPQQLRALRDARRDLADAQDALTDANRKAVTPADLLRQTESDLADQLDRAYKAAQQDIGGKIAAGLLPARAGAQELVGYLALLEQQFPQLAALIDPLIAKLPHTENTFASRDASGHVAVRRASGGPVGGSSWYWVGDQHGTNSSSAELLRLEPGSRGWVYSSAESRRIAAGYERAVRRADGGYVGTSVPASTGAVTVVHVPVPERIVEQIDLTIPVKQDAREAIAYAQHVARTKNRARNR